MESSHVYALNASHTDNGIQIGLLGGSMVLAPNAHCFSLTTKYLNSVMILKDRFRIEVKARLEFEEEISFVIDYCLGVDSGPNQRIVSEALRSIQRMDSPKKGLG